MKSRKIQFRKYTSEIYKSENSHRKVQVVKLQIGKYEPEDTNRKNTHLKSKDRKIQIGEIQFGKYKPGKYKSEHTIRKIQMGKSNLEIQVGKY